MSHRSTILIALGLTIKMKMNSWMGQEYTDRKVGPWTSEIFEKADQGGGTLSNLAN